MHVDNSGGPWPLTAPSCRGPVVLHSPPPRAAIAICNPQHTPPAFHQQAAHARMPLFRALHDLNVASIVDFVSASAAPYEPSQLYATATAENVEEDSIRRSESRTLVDEKLFSLCRALVRTLSASDAAYEFTVVPDNLTHLRYGPGGFFSKHVDHCRGTSNCVEEWTLIINVQPADVVCTGGHTIIHAASEGGASAPQDFDLTLPGRGLMFRKDIEHEARPVESGVKHVLCVNLWGRRKDRRGAVLLVSIGSPDTSTSAAMGPATDPAADPATDPAAALRAASSDAFSFALPAEDAAGSHVLKLVLADASREAEDAGASAPTIVRYAAPAAVSYDAFDLIFRICSRMHVTRALLEVTSRTLRIFTHNPHAHTERRSLRTAALPPRAAQAHAETLAYFFPGASLRWETLLLEQASVSAEIETFSLGSTVTIRGSGSWLDGKTAVVMQHDEASDGACPKDAGKVRVRVIANGDDDDKLRITSVDATVDATAEQSYAEQQRQHLQEESHLVSKDHLQVSASDRLINGVVQPYGSGEDPDKQPADVIVTASAERTKVVATLARELGLPFVEFKMMFVKGDIDGKRMPLTACWISLGGYDSIFSLRQFGIGEFEPTPLPLMKQLMLQDFFRKASRMQSGPPTYSQWLDETFREFKHAYNPLAPPATEGGAGIKCGARFSLPEALTIEGRDPEREEYSDNGLDEWERSWRVLGNPCFGLKVAAEGAWQDTEAKTRERANPMADAVNSVYIGGSEEDEDGYGDEYDHEYDPSIMDLIFSRRSGLSYMPALTYLPGASARTVGGGGDGEPNGDGDDEGGGDWRARALEAAAARAARQQTQLDASIATRQRAEEEAKAKAKADARAEWIAGSDEPFDAAQEAAFEKHWGEELEGMMEDDYWFEDCQQDLYGSMWEARCGRFDLDAEETAMDKELELELQTGRGGHPPAGTPLFHWDAAGKACFDEAEARAASELIAAMKLDERVAAAMGRVRFVFPQASTSMSASHICNHDWFGSFELLQVTGVVRLQANPDLVASALTAELEEKKALIAKREAEEQKRREQEKKRLEAYEKANREREQMAHEAAPAEELSDVENGYPASTIGSSVDDDESPKKRPKTAATTTQTSPHAAASGVGTVANALSDAARVVLAPLRRSLRLMEDVADAAADMLVPAIGTE